MAFEDEEDVLYKFEYHLQDHLGNTRVVFGGHSNGKAELVQQTDYYPFGLVMAQREYLSYDDFPENQVLANKYLYNGKEWQDEEIGGAKLDWYDYGARFYDPELGRWHVIDPNANEYYFTSPFSYCLNNPIIFVDPDGRKVKLKIFEAEVHASTAPLFKKTNEDSGLAISRWFGKGNDDYGNFIVKTALNFGEHGKDGDIFGADFGVSFMHLTDSKSKSLDQFLESESPTNVAIGPIELALGEGKFGIGIGAGLGAGSSKTTTINAFYLAYTDQDTEGIKGNIYSYSIEDGKLVFHVKQGDKNLSKVTTDIEPIEGKNGQYKTPNYIKNEKEEE